MRIAGLGRHSLPVATLALALALRPARAATLAGSDLGGQDLLPANGDILVGTFSNVGLFQVGTGTTVFVSPGTPLVVFAGTITVRGTIEGTGRGQPGGSGGAGLGAGFAGFGGGPGGVGGGGGAAAQKGGGGGGGGAGGGAGAGAGGGAAGALYGSTGTVLSPLSPDDLFMGSGGGGGGGGNPAANGPGGSGANGGGSVYLEASSITITGQILVSGSSAAAVTNSVAGGANPGAGGGGAGGSILIRAPGGVSFLGGTLAAIGAKGGDVIDAFFCRTISPGGGGAGGRVKIFFKSGDSFAVGISTAGGVTGGDGGFCGALDAPAPAAGLAGTASFGVIASSPSGFAAQAVYVTSISWAWSATPSFGNGPGNRLYRIFPATATAPLPSPEATAGDLATGATVENLIPNTTYFRFVTAFTDWGDSLPSNSVSTHTLANLPGAAAPAFSGMADTSLTLNWTAGVAANPGYTRYEINRSTLSDFSATVSTGFVVGLSSSPTGLSPNTTYFLRVRAINLAGLPTLFGVQAASATLASAPTAPAFGTVHVTSLAFSWSGGANPADTLYTAQVSSDNFFTLVAASATLNLSATFFNLTPGTQYFFRAMAVNRNFLPSAFCAVVSTKPGALSDPSAPGAPGQPRPDRQFSYDGIVLFSWAAAASGAGILDYHFLLGTTPGGNDVIANGVATVTSFTAAGLATGRSYYARVRARSNAGTLGEFSDISPGVPVFITAQAPPAPKPFNWPNPFDPAQGPTQIGFFLEEPATVVLKIFSLQGSLVYEESRRVEGTGNQVIGWSGANASGLRVAPGGYVVMIQKRYGSRVDAQKFKIAVVY